MVRVRVSGYPEVVFIRFLTIVITCMFLTHTPNSPKLLPSTKRQCHENVHLRFSGRD